MWAELQPLAAPCAFIANIRDPEAALETGRPRVTMSSRPPIKYVSGMPILGDFAENWENVKRFQARADDILIATYPKSGTTWMSEIVDHILSEGDTVRTKRGAIYERVPFLEYAVPDMPTGTESLNLLDCQRVIKTHLPVEILPKCFWDEKCKTIYIARNAKDVVVSYFHFYRMAIVHPEPGTWEEFLQNFMEGKVAFGSWFNHVKGWWNARKEKNILYILYEDMLENPKREIHKVFEFLGKKESEDEVEKIHQATSFQAMKNNPMANYTSVPGSVMDHSVSPFMRKGICGDWKNHFTVAQNEMFDAFYRKEMADTDLTFRF
uniref:Sulfotransferase n=1 Tax=Leptobrachium leishanense TaxID=445787 RepID=A0A8C5QW40_9ANUR